MKKAAAAVAGAQVSPPSSSNEENITKNTTTSILFQLLSATFLSNHPDLDSAHNHLISFLSGSSSDGGDKDGNHHDQDIDRFHKAYQKVIQDTKIFGRSPSTTSPQDLSLNLINELTLRYQTAIELQKKSEYLSSWTLSPQYWGKDYQDLLEKDQNIKESLRKLYEIRSHERIHQIPPYNERMIRYRRKYRV